MYRQDDRSRLTEWAALLGEELPDEREDEEERRY